MLTVPASMNREKVWVYLKAPRRWGLEGLHVDLRFLHACGFFDVRPPRHLERASTSCVGDLLCPCCRYLETCELIGDDVCVCAHPSPCRSVSLPSL